MQVAKKILVLLAILRVTSLAMGQQVVDGVHIGSPPSFMYLTPQTGSSSTHWYESWVKPICILFTQPLTGIDTGAYPSHQFRVYDPQNPQTLNNDTCFRSCDGEVFNRPVMAEAWNSDLYPGTYVDTVIQLGTPGIESMASGKKRQQILYSFVPDTNNPVLLVNFAFVTEDARHFYSGDPGFELAVLQHGTDDYLSLGNYDATHPYSRFWYRTPGEEGDEDPDNTPVLRPTQSCPVDSGCPCQYNVDSIFTYPYTIVAFDLSDQARAGQAVDFRIEVWGCYGYFHWSYCYFTAKMVPARLRARYCGGDSLKLSVPWGFDEDTYAWYNGKDSASTTTSDWFDPDDSSSPVVLQGSTKYNPLLRPNPAKPYYRCVVRSYTGIPFTYEAKVKYYDLKPSFSIKPKALTDEKSCDYGVVLHNTSSIGIIQPNGNGGVDTNWQNLEMHPEQCTWDFGDGSPLVRGFEPEHIYEQPGTYTVSLYIEDYERECKSVTIDTIITILPEYKENQYVSDTVSTCESKLPYYYKPEIFGYDNVTTCWNLNAVGDRQVNYTNALPQYDIKAWNGCDSIVKLRFDVLTPSVTIQPLGDFCDSAQMTLVASVSNAQQNAVEYTWIYMDSVMSITDKLLALSDGSYSVSIVDRTTQCEAKATYRIEPCMLNLFLPNCITPTHSPNEGPVQNDYFYLDRFVLRFISEVKFMVYSRNGEEVFYYEGKKNIAGEFVPPTPYADLPSEMDDRMVLWDGKVKGRVIRGTYIYTLWIVSGGKPYLYKGRLTVI